MTGSDIDTKKPEVVDTASASASSSSLSVTKKDVSQSDSTLDVTVQKNGDFAFGNERELEAFYEPIAEYVRLHVHFSLLAGPFSVLAEHWRSTLELLLI